MPEIDELIKKPFSYGAVMKRYIDKYVLPEDRSKLMQFADAACLRSQLSSRRSCVMHYRVMLGAMSIPIAFALCLWGKRRRLPM